MLQFGEPTAVMTTVTTPVVPEGDETPARWLWHPPSRTAASTGTSTTCSRLREKSVKRRALSHSPRAANQRARGGPDSASREYQVSITSTAGLAVL
jgi:hypothetical protein